MKTNKEKLVMTVQWSPFPGKSLGGALDGRTRGQKISQDSSVEERPSPEVLRRYLKNLGVFRKRKRQRCLSRELHRIAISN